MALPTIRCIPPWSDIQRLVTDGGTGHFPAVIISYASQQQNIALFQGH
jgi:hypothetical protein